MHHFKIFICITGFSFAPFSLHKRSLYGIPIICLSNERNIEAITEVSEWYNFYYEQFDEIVLDLGDRELILEQNFQEKKKSSPCSLVDAFYMPLPNHVDLNLFTTLALKTATCTKTDLYSKMQTLSGSATQYVIHWWLLVIFNKTLHVCRKDDRDGIWFEKIFYIIDFGLILLLPSQIFNQVLSIHEAIFSYDKRKSSFIWVFDMVLAVTLS